MTSNQPNASKSRITTIGIYLLSLVATFAIVFHYCGQYVDIPPKLDDFDYLALPPWTLQRGLNYWNPAWGWYFRPVFNNYISIVITVCHKNWTEVHYASFGVAALTAWMLGVLAYRLRSWIAGILAPILFTFASRKDEAVNWPAGANSLLAGCFYVATMLCCTLWRQTGRRRWYALSLIAFILTVCSKDDAISLPIALVLLDFGISPKLAALQRLKAMLPVFGLTVVYLVCDTIAYHYAVISSPGAALFAFEPGSRLIIFSHFLFQAFVLSYIDISALAPLHIIVFFAPLIFCIWKLRRQPLPLSLLLIAIVASMPAPLGTGMHSASGRFFFIPILMVSLMLGLFLDNMIRSGCIQTRVAAGAFFAAYIANAFVSFRIDDPAVIWTILFFACAAGVVLWRAKLIDGHLALAVLIATVFSQTPYFIEANALSFVVPASIVLIGAAMSWRSGIWQDILTFTVLIYAPYISIPMFLILAAILYNYRVTGISQTTLSQSGSLSANA